MRTWLLLVAATLLPAQPAGAAYHALLIANSEYEHWNDLRTPANDVDELDRILTTQYGYETQVLRNATRAEMVDAIETLNGRLSEDDSLLIYYAGHGHLRPDGGYWIGVDATQNSRADWLKYDAINDLVDVRGGAEARHVLVVADSCYSGAALRGDDVAEDPDPGETRTDWLARMHDRRSRTVMTSGGTEPVVDGVGNARHSIFAAELLERLAMNSGILDAGALYDDIKAEVHGRARRVLDDLAQAPEYGALTGTGHQGGDYLFIPVGMVPPTARAGAGGGGVGLGLRGPSQIVHQAAGPVHIGDETIADWAPTRGPCYDISFDYPHRADFLTLSYDVFGAENTSIHLADENTFMDEVEFPFETQLPEQGRTRPNYWTDGRSLRLPVDSKLSGRMTLRICGRVVEDPAHPGDLDDFQIRNVILRVN